VTLGARTPIKDPRTTAPSIGVLTLPTLSCPWVDEAADCKAGVSECRSSRARQSTEFRHDWPPHRTHTTKALMPVVKQVWNTALHFYGADKLWKQISREGVKVARCRVERPMRRLGLRGVKRGKVVRTTVSDAKAPCPLTR